MGVIKINRLWRLKDYESGFVKSKTLMSSMIDKKYGHSHFSTNRFRSINNILVVWGENVLVGVCFENQASDKSSNLLGIDVS